MASSAIRFVTGTKKNPTGTIFLQCHVKPGASKQREGVAAVTADTIELCVAAQAREGEANKSVLKVLSSILGLSKSELEISHGHKSRDKVVAVVTKPSGTQEDFVRVLQERLEKSVLE